MKSQGRDQICLGPIILKKTGERLGPKGLPMTYGESNGHVTDAVT